MKAVLMNEFGGVEVLKVGEVDKPTPKEGQVLIKVVATSINRPDLVQRQGNYPPPPGDSEILGLEVAGTIAEIGPGVDGLEGRRPGHQPGRRRRLRRVRRGLRQPPDAHPRQPQL